MRSMLRMTRWMTGALLAVCGAIIAFWSVFLTWYGSREGTDIRIQDLFNQMTLQSSSTAGSILIPMAVAAVLVLAGVIVGWRWLWALAGLVTITAVYLWGLRQAQTVPGLHATLVGAGPPLAFSGGALMLLGSVVAASRRRKHVATGAEERRVSPEWTPNAATEVGRSGSHSEPRMDDPRMDEHGVRRDEHQHL
ncbi:hypothetical protein KDL01_34645 [Actinospica durhamensis]|uniref:Uncharacterized protein n=1 Tax=Actinospica durhamensis TaxID=1508375 RepID=A0A941EUN7_9ACTN|nr:hypothetical protein [Actinospica durhamensis]MBR7838457.1 hypothetical protein [Actinospica durhamensis]